MSKVSVIQTCGERPESVTLEIFLPETGGFPKETAGDWPLVCMAETLDITQKMWDEGGVLPALEMWT